MRLTASKTFYVRLGDEKEVVTTASAWFDSRQQHAAVPSDDFAISLRVDGEFEPRVRQHVRSRYEQRVLSALHPSSPWRRRVVRWVTVCPAIGWLRSSDSRSWQRRP